MELNIHPEVFDLDPSLMIAAIVCQGMTVGSRHATLDQIWAERIPGIPRSLGAESLGQHPAVAPWRRVYSLFGAKPSKYPSSLEALLKRLVKDGTLPRINDLVDIYNWISVSHLIPAGGEDLGRIIGNIRLVRAQGGETFHPLHGETLELIPAGEVIYADDLDVICRRWNWRESDRTKLT
jgi:DNA/RNA-binding domain of Phe-tRNA-synthetase-like protein